MARKTRTKNGRKNVGASNAPKSSGSLPVHNVQAAGMVPRVIGGNGTSIRIRNTELVTGFTGSYGLDITPYNRGAAKGAVASSTESGIANANYGTVYLNPGAFGWLKTIAAGYSKYKFHNIKLHFRSQSGTQTAGFVSMAVIHDPEDLPLGAGEGSISAAVAGVSQNETYVSGPVWSPDLCLDYNGANSIYKSYPNTGYNQFVELTAAGTGSSGTFPLSGAVVQSALLWTVENTVPAAFLGRIYATYDVELSHPVAPSFSAS